MVWWWAQEDEKREEGREKKWTEMKNRDVF